MCLVIRSPTVFRTTKFNGIPIKAQKMQKSRPANVKGTTCPKPVSRKYFTWNSVICSWWLEFSVHSREVWLGYLSIICAWVTCESSTVGNVILKKNFSRYFGQSSYPFSGNLMKRIVVAICIVCIARYNYNRSTYDDFINHVTAPGQ